MIHDGIASLKPALEREVVVLLIIENELISNETIERIMSLRTGSCNCRSSWLLVHEAKHQLPEFEVAEIEQKEYRLPRLQLAR